MFKKYFLILVFLLVSCSTKQIIQKKPISSNITNEIKNLVIQTECLQLAYNSVNQNIISNELSEINDKITQAKNLGLNRILLISGIYEDSYYPEYNQNNYLKEIIFQLEMKGFKVYPFYKQNFGQIDKYSVESKGIIVSW